MSQWTDRVVNHPIHRQLRELEQVLDSSDPGPEGSSDAVEAVARLRTVAIAIRAFLESTDPELVNTSPLDNMHSYVSAMVADVHNFVANRTERYLTSANNHADSALTQLSQIYAPRSISDVEGVRDAVVSLRRGVGQHLRYIESDFSPIRAGLDGLKSRVQEMSSEIISQRAQLTSLTAEYQRQFSEAQETRQRQFAEGEKSRLDQFADAEADREERVASLFEQVTQRVDTFVADLEKWRDNFETALSTAEKRLENAYEEEAGKSLARMENVEEKAERLLGVIGNMGVTSGYQKAANEARRVTWFWQVVTIASMAALITIAYRAFLPAVTGGFTWESFAGRVFVSLTVGVLAAYAAHQAGKYQFVERRNRRTELELASIGPYLTQVTDAGKQEELRVMMAQRTFGREEDPEAIINTSSPATVLDVVMKSKEFRAFLTDIIKSSKA